MLDKQVYTLCTFYADNANYRHIWANSATSITVNAGDSYGKSSFIEGTVSNAPKQWIPVATDDGSGDFRLFNMQGYWLTQSAKTAACSLTDNPAKASTFRLVDATEQRDSVWVNFWQLKNMDEGNHTFSFYGYGNQWGEQTTGYPMMRLTVWSTAMATTTT